MLYKKFISPVGVLTIFSSGKGICRIDFENEKSSLEGFKEGSDFYIEECIRQLDLYFQKKLKNFDVRLDLQGTEFQKAVWKEILKIPYGEVKTYGEIARLIGKPKAARAVGQALNKNPIPIIIPCHRVIGSSEDLTGFGGGIEIKKFLLRHEGVEVH
ncbi:MAG: Methylated-DNA--protein-cysteine methyltransferase [Caldanaerobacter subterraneus]|uniref:Methylated-DNA--protein-cysteine methyltransferase n=2 Tax=Thermoanaerobacter TaxID=1754 RepID=B0KBK0_THEP3|nr:MULTISPECIES: methylated-DNA--[protein]-cysteine S-methyltransferase [Thermoanaerobacter]KUJ91154.1 MAG: methylated-DNA/protein-cysteine methyltransferase [Thermoanaerobacter thermocopriae]KUK34350.1 MAG: Methylated-DNA--protein-cysteine methyltransferase [Caldanaerobacter subterraneus]ABY91936.1 methylated-DNA--protein-cysteine methyltransferase [Thermoanaerobacter sp. X514]ABY93879.1 methylated-DNA--protein-cysteine methyltransferase [Thermoanaerobacter pseudethanolicus ATCC 33223]ADV7884